MFPSSCTTKVSLNNNGVLSGRDFVVVFYGWWGEGGLLGWEWVGAVFNGPCSLLDFYERTILRKYFTSLDLFDSRARLCTRRGGSQPRRSPPFLRVIKSFRVKVFI